MNIKMTLTINGGKDTTTESHSMTIKDVITLDQVKRELDLQFGQFFGKQKSLADVPPKKKKET